VTPFLELAMAAYFVIAIGVAIDHRHYLSLPFLGLFLCGFGYVGWVSLWQGGVGVSLRRAFAGFVGRGRGVMPPPSVQVAKRRDTITGDIVLPDAPALGQPETAALTRGPS
jgi:hypothetical protein